MNLSKPIVFAAICVLPSATLAQDAGIDAAVTLGYSFGDIADVDYSAVSLGFASDIRLTSAFSVGMDFDLQATDLDVSGLDPELDVMRLSVEPRYDFGKGLYAGLYYQNSDIDISADALGPIEIGLELNSFGVFGGIDNGTWGAEAYYGRSDTDPELSDDIEITDFGLSGFYAASENVEIFGSYQSTNIDAGSGAPEIDLDLIAVGGSYAFQNGLMTYGTIGRITLGDSSDTFDASITEVALGVTYSLESMGTPVPAVLGFEAAKRDFDIDFGGGSQSESGMNYTFSLTIPLGKAPAQPLNSSARIARGDVRTVLSSTLMSF